VRTRGHSSLPFAKLHGRGVGGRANWSVRSRHTRGPRAGGSWSRKQAPAYIRSVRHLPRSFEHRPTGGGRGWVRSPSARTRRVAPTQFPILVCSVGEPGLVDESPRGHRLCGDTPHPPRARAPKVWRTRERLASGAIDGVMSRSCHRRTSAPNAPRCSRAASARPKSEQATLWGESRCAARRAGTA